MGGPKWWLQPQSLCRAGEICLCTNDSVRIFSVADFGTLKYSWEMRETPFGETSFVAVGLWLAVQVTQTAVPGVGLRCFCSKKCFTRFFVSRFQGFFYCQTNFFIQMKSVSSPARERSVSPGRKRFRAGDTGLGRQAESIFRPLAQLVAQCWFIKQC